MNQIFISSRSFDICKYSGGNFEPLNTDSDGRYTVGVFDIIKIDEDAVFLFEIASIAGSEIPYGYESQYFDENAENRTNEIMEISVEEENIRIRAQKKDVDFWMF